MKVLCSTYQTALQNPGGGEIQLSKTVDALREQDQTVMTFDPFEERIPDYDVFHAFSSHHDNLTTVSYAADNGIPTAVSTIYWEPMGYIRQQSGLRKYVKMAEELGKRATRKVGITYLDKQKQLYDMADVLLPNSEAEAELIASKFDISREKLRPVPNAVDRRFADADPARFAEEHGMEDFVLFVGVLSRRKNVARALAALDDLDEDIVVIGPEGDTDYAAKCRSIAGDNVHFLGGIDHDDPMLASAYAACEVFLLPSWYETPGLAALEASLAGAKVVVTDRGSTQEYFRDYAEYVDPSEPNSIRAAVESALAKETPAGLRDRVLENFMWENAARETISAYRSIA